MKIDEQTWKKCTVCGKSYLGLPTDRTCPVCKYKVGKEGFTMNKAKKLLNFIEKKPVSELINGELDEFEKVLELYGFVPSHKKTVTSRWYNNSLNHQVKVSFDEKWGHYSQGGELLFDGEGVEALRIYLEKTYGGEEKKSYWKEVSQ